MIFLYNNIIVTYNMCYITFVEYNIILNKL